MGSAGLASGHSAHRSRWALPQDNTATGGSGQRGGATATVTIASLLWSRSNKAKTGPDTGQGPPTTSLPLHDSQPPSGLSFTFQGAALRGVAQMPWAQKPLARVPLARDVAGAVGAAPTGAVSEACQATTAGQGDAGTQARRECGECLRVYESCNTLMEHLRSERWV
jgi:hypothetical protein